MHGVCRFRGNRDERRLPSVAQAEGLKSVALGKRNPLRSAGYTPSGIQVGFDLLDQVLFLFRIAGQNFTIRQGLGQLLRTFLSHFRAGDMQGIQCLEVRQ